MTTKDKQSFYDKYYPVIVKATEGTGIHPEVAMAQMIQETGWGTSKGFTEDNAGFGIKPGKDYKGTTKNRNTFEEDIDGNATELKADFRSYNSIDDSVNDYVDFLSSKDRYSDAISKDTPEEQIKALKDAGYATDDNYVSSVTSLMDDGSDYMEKSMMSNPDRIVSDLSKEEQNTYNQAVIKYAGSGKNNEEAQALALYSMGKLKNPQTRNTIDKIDSKTGKAEELTNDKRELSKKETNFEKRFNDRSLNINNNDGTSSSHKMMSFESDDKYYAAPTIIEKDGKLIELSKDDAIKYALDNNEFTKFDSEKESQAYAEGGYKTGTNLDPIAENRPDYELKTNQINDLDEFELIGKKFDPKSDLSTQESEDIKKGVDDYFTNRESDLSDDDKADIQLNVDNYFDNLDSTKNLEYVDKKVGGIKSDPRSIPGLDSDAKMTADIPTNTESGVPEMTDAGNMVGAVSGAVGNLANLATTIASRDQIKDNPFANYASDALSKLASMKSMAGSMRDMQMQDATLSKNTARANNRNMARGVGDMRALDMGTHVAGLKNQRAINSAYENQIMNISGQEAGMLLDRDKTIMSGQERTDAINQANKDNYLSNLSSNITDFSTTGQQLGKTMNQQESNKLGAYYGSQGKYGDYSSYFLPSNYR